MLLFLSLIIMIMPALFADSIGTIIDQPGIYLYGSDITANPTDANDAIITVSANQVVIDLQNHVFQQDPTNQIASLIGIKIMPGVNRVTIQNGNIKNLTGTAIEIGDGCTGIQLRNLQLTGCNSAGVNFLGTITGISFIQISDCIILTCSGSNGSPAYGMRAGKLTQCLLENNIFTGNDAVLSSSGYGCYISSSTGLNFNNNLVSGNGGFEIGVGLYLEHCDNAFIRNSIFNANMSRSSSSAAYAAGLEMINCHECQVLGCEFVKNVNPFVQAYGCKVVGGYDNTFGNCRAQVNTGGTYACGFDLNGCIRPKIDSAIINGNSAAYVYGIRLTNTCLNAYIADNEIVNNIGIAASYGIYDDSQFSSNCIIQNKAFNHDFNYSITYTTGISLPLVQGSLSNSIIGMGATGTAFSNQDINP